MCFTKGGSAGKNDHKWRLYERKEKLIKDKAKLEKQRTQGKDKKDKYTEVAAEIEEINVALDEMKKQKWIEEPESMEYAHEGQTASNANRPSLEKKTTSFKPKDNTDNSGNTGGNQV